MNRAYFYNGYLNINIYYEYTDYIEYYNVAVHCTYKIYIHATLLFIEN
jgi:hypothetical protein